MKLQKNKKSGQYLINLPLALIKAYSWQAGDEISIQAGEKLALILRKQ